MDPWHDNIDRVARYQERRRKRFLLIAVALFLLALLLAIRSEAQQHKFGALDVQNAWTAPQYFNSVLNYYVDTGAANAYAIAPGGSLQTVLVSAGGSGYLI